MSPCVEYTPCLINHGLNYNPCYIQNLEGNLTMEFLVAWHAP